MFKDLTDAIFSQSQLPSRITIPIADDRKQTKNKQRNMFDVLNWLQ